MIKTSINYIVMMLMILASGNPFVIGYINEIATSLGIGFILVFLYLGKSVKKTQVIFLSFQIIALILPLTLIDPNPQDISTYLKLILVIISAQIYMKLVGIDTFIHTYINIIYFLCLTSLVIFLILTISPQIQDYVPESYNYRGIGYKNAGLLIWHIEAGQLFRNYSIFWEPGVFAAFSVIALILAMDSRSLASNKVFIIITSSLLLSGSTTAFMLSPFFIIHRVLKYNNIKMKYSLYRLFLLILVIVSSILFWAFTEGAASPLNKLSNLSFNLRFLSLITDYQIFSESILGVGPVEYFNRVLLYTDGLIGGTFNAIVSSLAIYGLPFTLVSLWLYYYSIKSLHLDRLGRYLAMFAVVFIFFTQMLMYSIFFLCFSAMYISKSNREIHQAKERGILFQSQER